MTLPTKEAVDREYQIFCLQTGHLFTGFARMENLLTSALKLHLAFNLASPEDTPSMKLASAIYGSMRLSASRDTIKRILAVEDAPKPLREFIEGVFAQLGHIEALRNKIAHQTVTPAHKDMGGFWQVSDLVNVRELSKLKVWAFDTKAIMNAAEDVVAAADRLGSRPVNGQLFSQLNDLSPPPWRYKPSQLKLVPHSKLRTPPGL